MKPVDKKKNPGLAKLPTEVRNKMGFMKRGGAVKKKIKKKKRAGKMGGGMMKKRMSRGCLLYTSPSPRDGLLSRMPSSA